jgi:hypothetical protein
MRFYNTQHSYYFETATPAHFFSFESIATSENRSRGTRFCGPAGAQALLTSVPGSAWDRTAWQALPAGRTLKSSRARGRQSLPCRSVPGRAWDGGGKSQSATSRSASDGLPAPVACALAPRAGRVLNQFENRSNAPPRCISIKTKNNPLFGLPKTHDTLRR